jgi:hypothetical protein
MLSIHDQLYADYGPAQLCLLAIFFNEALWYKACPSDSSTEMALIQEAVDSLSDKTEWGPRP